MHGCMHGIFRGVFGEKRGVPPPPPPTLPSATCGHVGRCSARVKGEKKEGGKREEEREKHPSSLKTQPFRLIFDSGDLPRVQGHRGHPYNPFPKSASVRLTV